MAVEQSRAGERRPAKGMTSWERWGLVLLIPYVLLFLVFVLYPVGYGLWLARQPSSYVKLFDDPIFFRSVINTLVFLGVGRDEVAKELFEVEQALLAEAVDAAAEGGAPGAQSGEEGSVHRAVYTPPY